MTQRSSVAVLSLLLAVLLAVFLPRSVQHRSPVAVTSAPTTTGAAPPAATGPGDANSRADVGFASAERMREHFAKHGREFGASSAEEYVRLAQVLRDRPAGGDVLEAVRADGVATRFDRASGAFLAFDADGTLRTFFRPNDGEAYFRRQLSREHGRR
jgi:pyocin large subunit-like protein